MRVGLALPLLAFLLGTSACHIVHVGSEASPPRIESRGLVDGHVAVGVPAEDRFLHADLFDGSSPGAIAELSLWKLFRVEVGLAGASLGIGPLQLGLGVLFYDPEVPEMEKRDAEGSNADAEPVPAEAAAPSPES